MRVLQVVHQFLPEYLGGTELYTAGLAAALRDAGHAVAVFTGGSRPGDSTWEGIPVRRVTGGLRGTQGPAAAFVATFRNPTVERSFLDTLEEFAPDVVHFQHLHGLSGRLPALAARRAASCFTLHDYWFRCPTSQLLDHRGRACGGPRLGVNCTRCAAHRLGGGAWGLPLLAAAPLLEWRRRWVPRAMAAAGLLLAPSRFLAALAERHGLPAGRLRVVDFGAAALPGSPAWAPRPPGTPLRVAYAGALHPSKGVQVLVQAAGLLPPGTATVTVAGDLDAYPAFARTLQAAAGPAVTFCGRLDRAGIGALLARTDVLAVPSLWFENAPLVVSEAFGAGVPVVASDIGALAEKVSDGTDGLLHPPGDSGALAAVLRRLAEAPGLLERLRRGVRPGATRADHHAAMVSLYAELTLSRARVGVPS